MLVSEKDKESLYQKTADESNLKEFKRAVRGAVTVSVYVAAFDEYVRIAKATAIELAGDGSGIVFQNVDGELRIDRAWNT